MNLQRFLLLTTIALALLREKAQGDRSMIQDGSMSKYDLLAYIKLPLPNNVEFTSGFNGLPAFIFKHNSVTNYMVEKSIPASLPSEFSIRAIIKPQNHKEGYIFAITDASSGDIKLGLKIGPTSSDSQMFIGLQWYNATNKATEIARFTVPKFLNQWTRLAIESKSGTLSLYINCKSFLQKVAWKSPNNLSIASTDRLHIAERTAQSSAGHYGGLIQELDIVTDPSAASSYCDYDITERPELESEGSFTDTSGDGSDESLDIPSEEQELFTYNDGKNDETNASGNNENVEGESGSEGSGYDIIHPPTVQPSGSKGEVGQKGEKGEAGTSGRDGSKGVTGQPGPDGQKGEKGYKGEKGLPGIGIPGFKGEKGDSGTKGEPGISLTAPPPIPGQTGSKGEKGVKGEPGEDGEDGEDGTKGERGAPGMAVTLPPLTGPIGPQGPKGEKGTKGENGISTPGASGVQGEKGEKGDAGLQGKDGSDGLSGAPGQIGPMGQPGLKGEKGESGQDGSSGIQGLPGPPGICRIQQDASSDDEDFSGSGLIFNGCKIGRPGPPGSRGLPGIQGLPGQPGAKGVKGDPGASGVPGVKGLKGAKGNFGLQGAQGINGPKGIKGEPGRNGLNGNNGKKGDTGYPGKQGSPGLRGIQGPPGLPGKINISSIPSIQGEKGQKGDPGAIIGPDGNLLSLEVKGERGNRGKKGVRGIPGVKGMTGEMGLPGRPGAPGLKGEKGVKGSTGDPGISGKKGDQGIQGPPGPPGTGQSIWQGSKGQKGEIGLPGRRGKIGRSGRPGYAGAKGDKGSKGEPAVGPSVITTKIYRSIEKMQDQFINVPQGTLAFVIDQQQVFLKVAAGWSEVMLANPIVPVHSNLKNDEKTPFITLDSNESDTTTSSTAKSTSTRKTATTTVPASIFVTTQNQIGLKLIALNFPLDGNMNGLSGVDALCFHQAREAGLDGTYRAFLSSNNQDIKSIVVHKRDQVSVPIINVLGQVLFRSWLDIFQFEETTFDPYLLYSFNRQQIMNNNSRWPMKKLWHGSYRNGRLNRMHTCNSWRTNSMAVTGMGTQLVNGKTLLGNIPLGCSSSFVVLCIENGTGSLRNRYKK